MQAQTQSRSATVKNLLISKAHAMTVREICRELGIPDFQSKFISSTLVTWEKAGKVTALKRPCSVTGRFSQGYAWTAAGSQSGPTAGPAAGSQNGPAAGPAAGPSPNPRPRKPRAKKAKAAPPPPPPPNAHDQAKADAKRRAAEQARKAREDFHKRQTAQDEVSQAKLIFQKFTGYRKDDPDGMKLAYRKAALLLHPDRGGDSNNFALLSNSWTVLKTSMGI